MTRLVVVHARDAVLTPDDGPVVAHAYGPFKDLAAALAFEATGDPGDDCHKFVLDIVGPHPGDRALADAVADAVPGEDNAMHHVHHYVPWAVLVAGVRDLMQGRIDDDELLRKMADAVPDDDGGQTT